MDADEILQWLEENVAAMYFKDNSLEPINGKLNILRELNRRIEQQQNQAEDAAGSYAELEGDMMRDES